MASSKLRFTTAVTACGPCSRTHHGLPKVAVVAEHGAVAGVAVRAGRARVRGVLLLKHQVVQELQGRAQTAGSHRLFLSFLLLFLLLLLSGISISI
jgi:hypothetical protein